MKKRKHMLLGILTLSLFLVACSREGLDDDPTKNPIVSSKEETEVSTEAKTEAPTEAKTEEPTTEETTTEEATTEEETTEEATTEETTEKATTEEETTELDESTPEESETWKDLGDGLYDTGRTYVYDKLMFPKETWYILRHWTLDGAEEKDGAWYKPYWKLCVPREAITLYCERSMDSEKVSIEALTQLRAVATDRENWIYLETLDQSMGGWLPVEWNDEQLDYELVDSSREKSFSMMLGNITPHSDIGGHTDELSLDCPLLADLEVGEARGIWIEDLAKYAEENQEMLMAQPGLWETIQRRLSWSTDEEAIEAYMYVYKNNYSSPLEVLDDFWTSEDGERKAIIIEAFYAMGAEEKATGFYGINTSVKGAIHINREDMEKCEFVVVTHLQDYDLSILPEEIR